MTILLTNDDGIHSEGILAAKKALQKVGRVIVVAPERPRSACGHSITLHKPLRVEPVRMLDGEMGYATSGTPSDCVSLGVLDIVDEPVDLVVSGINRGPNLGYDLTYSGTVSAAMEGAIMGIQSVAMSLASYADDVTYDYAAEFVAFLAGVLKEHNLPAGMLLNVNIPGVPADRIAGIEVTRQGKRHYAGRIEKRVDPMGKAYYWLGGDDPLDEMEEGTDVKAIADDIVSVTPVHLDMTGYSVLSDVTKWGVESFRYKPGSE